MKCGVFYSNLNGFKGKDLSLQAIIEKLQPEIVVLCETKLGNISVLKESLPKYDIMYRCIKLGKAGVAIGARKNSFGSFVDVSGTENMNIIVGKISWGKETLRVIAAYAPQETDLKEERESFYEDLSVEIMRCRMVGESFMVIGDLNAKLEKLEVEEVAVGDNDNEISTSETPNGKLLLSLLAEHDLKVVNFSDKCSGKWTHVIRTSGKASCLDYVLTTGDFYENSIDSMLIDETCLLCPYSLKKVKGSEHRQFSDHNSITIELTLPRSGSDKPQKIGPKKWRITEEGLTQFHEITNGQDQYEVSDDSYSYLVTYIENCMNECFKSVRTSKGRSNRNEKISHKFRDAVKGLMKIYKQGKTQRRVVLGYLSKLQSLSEKDVAKRQSDLLNERLKKLTIDDKLSLDEFWKLRKSRSNQGTCLSSVINDKGVEISSVSGILNEYRNEFIQRLQPPEIDDELKRYEELTLILSKLCVEEAGEVKSANFEREELDKAIGGLKRKKATPDSFPPEVYIDSGQEMREILLQVFNRIKVDQKSPDEWDCVKITPMYKNKGSVKKLVNQRGIFLSVVVSKIFEKMIKSRISEPASKVCLWQAGSRCERSTQDQTFLVRSAVNHAKYLNKPLYLTLYDFRQCFDKVWLEEALISLWKLGVNDDMLKLISLLNEKSVAVVKTSLGETEKFVLGPNAKQGTVLGPILSSASIGECCEEMLDGGASIGSAIIRALAFVDDLLGMNHLSLDVHNSHQAVISFSKKKRQPLNEDKCVILPINVTDSMSVPVLTVNGRQMDIVKKAKYLGDIFNTRGTNSDLIDDRVANGLKCIISTMSMAREITLGVHLMKTLISLYKIVFLKVVTFNSGAWNDITGQQMNQLRTVQLKYLKRILHTPSSTTNCFIFLELGIVPIEYSIHINQLQFLHHILSLPEHDPVKISYNQQKLFTFEKNWFNEVAQVRKRYGITENDDEIAGHSKDKWKDIVTSKVNGIALECLNKENTTKSKTAHHPAPCVLNHQSYFDYLKPSESRLFFAIRSGTLDIKTFRKYNYEVDDVSCRLCQKEEESVEHIVNRCEAISRTSSSNIDIHSMEKEVVKMIVDRMKEFIKRSEEKEKTAVAVVQEMTE